MMVGVRYSNLRSNKQVALFLSLHSFDFGTVYRLLTPKRMTRQESLDSSDMTVGGYTSLWR